MSFLFSSQVFAATWTEPTQVPVEKICGELLLKKTWYDGIQPVFSQKDSSDKVVTKYFLVGATPRVAKLIERLKLDEAEKVCVVGFASSQMTIDSPKEFFTFEVIHY